LKAVVSAARGRLSLRRYLLLGILVPVLAVVGINTASLYAQALDAADTAYDRTLLASAKAIGELLEVGEDDSPPRLRATLPYSALEAFEADNRSRMYYKVAGFGGEMVSGFADLPTARPPNGQPSVYAALVHFYDDHYQGEPVRMAVLLQPVSGQAGQGMATIQVAETLELRHTLARRLLAQTLWQQAVLLGVIALVVVVVVQRATRPVRELSQRLQSRAADNLAALPTADAPRELQPIVEATNAVMARLANLLEHQKRFVRDASHQLRTPLAVLKAQVQSAQRGDVAPPQALAEIATTVQRATELANQMLALAKVEQLRQQSPDSAVRWDTLVREVALDVSALIAEAQLDFDIETTAAPVQAHEWALRELTRNLLHNAIKHTPPGGRLAVRLVADVRSAALTVADSGPGISADQRQRLFQPFAAAGPRGGSGLGLAICREIVLSLQGSIELNNRQHGGRTDGLDAVVRLPLHPR
jgi:two-component system sensor histidine kinase TctE